MAHKLKTSVAAVFLAAMAVLLTVGCASQLPRKAALGPDLVDRIVVYKAAHKMTVYRANQPIREFHVALGTGGLGPKQRQGDGRVPEGRYFIAGRNPDSAFHLSLLISYPSPEEAKAAWSRGVDPGSEIMIHGLPNGQGGIGAAHRRTDWTLGCIAVTNEEIEWLWRSVPDGTSIEIYA